MYTLENDDVKLEVLRYKQEQLSYKQISEITGIPKTTLGDFVSGRTYKTWWEKYGKKPIASGQYDDHHEDIERLKGKTFIFTSAQNNTYVHPKFLETLEKAAEELDAQILVGTFNYNLSGFQNLQKWDNEVWYDPKVCKYIKDKPVMVADGLIWCGELNILPTAVNPLSGLHSYTKEASGIVPHAKVQLESVPTHKSAQTKMMYTTGAITKRNYIQKKAGQKASFHHIFGALIVEVDDDGDWFVRQIVAEKDTGCFYDLNKYYTPNGSYTVDQIEGINWGDLHSEKKDDEVYQASFGKHENSLLNLLKPKYQFVHDVLDFESRNHHNIADPYFRFKKYINGKDSVKDNVFSVIDTLCEMDRDDCVTVVVESNHDLALERWLKTADYKTDPANAIFFLECQLQQYKKIESGDEKFSIFEWVVKQNAPNYVGRNLDEVIFLRTDESFKICDDEGNGIECGQHGHNGANGSRGGMNVYQKMGARYNIGHSHTAGIKDGVYQSGVSGKLDMGYNIGGSSWSHSHIVTYPNGKRAIITIKNGKHSLKR